jgi:hypothetical protein
MAVPVPKLTAQSVADPAAMYAFLVAFAQKFQDVLEKLDADAGITDTDYESLHGFAAGDIDTGGRGVTL